MEQMCIRCGKRSRVGGKRKLLRGHYNPTATVRRRPNLQWVRLPIPLKGIKAGIRVRMCTKCMKALAKARK